MSPARMDRIEAGIRAIIAFNEAWNRHDVDGMMQRVSEAFIFESTSPPPGGTRFTGKAAIAQYWQDFFSHSPKAHFKIEELFGYGCRCIMRWKYEDVDAQGKMTHLEGVDLFRVQEGTIHEQLSYAKG